MSTTEEWLESIADDVRATQRVVRKIASHVLPGAVAEHQDDIRHETMIDLVLNPLFRSWCRDAGLSTYECDVLAEGTISGCMRRELLFDGIRMGISSAVFRMRHEPEETGEAVRAWAFDEEPREDAALPMSVAKLGAYIEQQAKSFETLADRAPDPNHGDYSQGADPVFLLGKASGIRDIGKIVLAGIGNILERPSEPKSPSVSTDER